MNIEHIHPKPINVEHEVHLAICTVCDARSYDGSAHCDCAAKTINYYEPAAICSDVIDLIPPCLSWEWIHVHTIGNYMRGVHSTESHGVDVIIENINNNPKLIGYALSGCDDIPIVRCNIHIYNMVYNVLNGKYISINIPADELPLYQWIVKLLADRPLIHKESRLYCGTTLRRITGLADCTIICS